MKITKKGRRKMTNTSTNTPLALETNIRGKYYLNSLITN
jgi:hypothetical protein